MSPVAKIAIRRARRDMRKNIFLAASVFFSVMIISLLAFFLLQVSKAGVEAYKDLPIGEFIGRLKSAMRLSVILLAAVTTVTVRINCSLRASENSALKAVLESIGATLRQRQILVLWDVLLIYTVPTALGAIAGAAFGVASGIEFSGSLEPLDNSVIAEYVLTLFTVIAAMLGLVIICLAIPSCEGMVKGVIRRVRGQNPNASTEKHGYRQSRTYQSQEITKRLARKGTEFYSENHKRISVAFSAAVIYPVIVFAMIYSIIKAEIVIDINPFDGVNTAEAVISAVDGIFLFLIGGFFALTVTGICQGFVMTQIYISGRQASAIAYRYAGMTLCDIKKMIQREIFGALLKGLIVAVFSSVTVSALYATLI